MAGEVIADTVTTETGPTDTVTVKSGVSHQDYPALTGIRAIAAYLVFAHHYTAEPSKPELYSFANITHQGYIGVSIFFTLSGFLITHRYETTMRRSELARYFWNRFCRVYPLYLILTLATLAYHGTGGFKEFFYNVTLLKGLSRTFVFTGIGQGWSLTVEECFYAAAPLIWIASRWIGLAGVTLAIYAVGIGLAWLGGVVAFDGFFSGFTLMSTYTFFGRCFEFIVGIYLARLWRSWQARGEHQPTRPSSLFSFTTLGLVGICGIMVFFSRTVRMGIFDAAGLPVHNFLLPIFTALVFWGLLTEKSLLRLLLSTSLFQLLGRSSYAFYLIHAGIWQIRVFNPFLGGGEYPSIWQFFVYNLIAIALYLAIEKPLHKRLRNWIKFKK